MARGTRRCADRLRNDAFRASAFRDDALPKLYSSLYDSAGRIPYDHSMANEFAAPLGVAELESLTPDAAYVLQLAGPLARPDATLCGRVEHIASGAWAYFADLNELLEFLRTTGPARSAASTLPAARSGP